MAFKKGLDKSVSSLSLDQIYNTALNAGALGGKILGAGGGGYFLFIANPRDHKNIKNKLKKLKFIDFELTNQGSKVLKFSMEENNLSIVIPTFKREKQIIQILDNLNNQISDNVFLEVNICDSYSNYDDKKFKNYKKIFILNILILKKIFLLPKETLE